MHNTLVGVANDVIPFRNDDHICNLKVQRPEHEPSRIDTRHPTKQDNTVEGKSKAHENSLGKDSRARMAQV